MVNLTAQQIKDLILPIPAEDFIKGNFVDERSKKCCVIGHIQRVLSEIPDNYYQNLSDWNGNDRSGIRDLSRDFFRSNPDKKELLPYKEFSIAGVNNGDAPELYPEPVIKDRVIHCLDDMIAAGY